jgi:formylglycine-generating enzyme required for sulfatase activity
MFEALIATFFGTAGKAVTGKAVNASLEAVAEGVRKQLAGQEASAAQKAVAQAVEAARREIRDRYFGGEDELSRDVVKLLDHPPFAQDVVRILLVRGQPDLDALRHHYLSQAKDGEAASERWERMKVPLDSFIASLERHLQADPHFGPLLQDLQQLARLGGIEEMSRQIAETSERVALATEKGVDLQVEQSLRLGEIVGWLETIAAGLAMGSTPRPPPGKLTVEERAYLRSLRAECNRLPLAEDDRDIAAESHRAAGQKRLRASLSHVYVTLETTAEASLDQVLDRLGVPQGERRKVQAKLEQAGSGRGRGRLETGEVGLGPLLGFEGGDLPKDHPLRPWVKDAAGLKEAVSPQSALDALLAEKRLVLLGDPGSGKSTFVNHLAMTLAGGLLGEDPEWRATLGNRFPDKAPWFPLRIELRRWSTHLAKAAQAGEEGVGLLYGVLEKLTGVDRKRWLGRFQDPETLVLFDGLDEVPPARGEDEEEGAPSIDRRRLIVEAVEEFSTSHPCRVVVTCRVKPYEAGGYEVGELPVFRLAPLGQEKIRHFTRRWYEELALVGRLSPEDAEVCRDRLLVAVGGGGVLGEMAGTPLLLTMLAQVNSRSPLPENRAELYHECAQQLLWKWEEKRPENLAGLLAAADGLEKLDLERALCRLAYEIHGASGEELADVPADKLRGALAGIHPKPFQGRAWAEEVIDLIRDRGGLLVEEETDHFSFPHRSFQEYFAARWLVEQGDAPATAWKLAVEDVWREVVLLACGMLKLGPVPRLSDILAILSHLVAGPEPQEPLGWQRVLVAGRGWLEFGPQRATGGALEVLGGELRERIPARLTTLMQHPDLPAAQRLEAGLLLADLGVLPDDLDAWVEIPADKLPYSFEIGKYPVTNAQFRRFFDAGGYEKGKPWWSEEAKGAWGGGLPEGPRLWGDRKFNRATQPVVGVSWYEAVAYCAWLTEDLRAKDEIGDDREVRLAAEEEWVRAAGGPEGTKYPWGKKFEAWRVNSEENGLGQPTPVSMYPGGKSPEGVFDLAGNVWEWLTDKDKDGWPYLKGGAYYRDAGGVGASARVGYYPRSGALSLGFRCVLVHTSRTPEVPAGNGRCRPAPPPRGRHERRRGLVRGWGSPPRPGINPRATEVRRLKPASRTKPFLSQAGFIRRTSVARRLYRRASLHVGSHASPAFSKLSYSSPWTPNSSSSSSAPCSPARSKPWRARPSKAPPASWPSASGAASKTGLWNKPPQPCGRRWRRRGPIWWRTSGPVRTSTAATWWSCCAIRRLPRRSPAGCFSRVSPISAGCGSTT